MLTNTFVKEYPEFGYNVEYHIQDDLSASKNDKPTKEIDWIVRNTDGDYLMHGVFKSANFYSSSFDLPISAMEENTYENLFYLYFENIKTTCIELVEDEDVEQETAEEDKFLEEINDAM